MEQNPLIDIFFFLPLNLHLKDVFLYLVSYEEISS